MTTDYCMMVSIWYVLFAIVGSRNYMPIYDKHGVRQREQKEWRDDWISERHRTWGYDLPATDIDFMLVEYTGDRPVALIEYKTTGSIDYVGWLKVLRGHRPVSNLATEANLPSFIVAYDIQTVTFYLRGTNQLAEQHQSQMTWLTLTEAEIVAFLRELRKANAKI